MTESMKKKINNRGKRGKNLWRLHHARFIIQIMVIDGVIDLVKCQMQCSVFCCGYTHLLSKVVLERKKQALPC